MAELIIEIIGWVGMFLIIVAYFLITWKKLDRESKVYHGMNFFGGLFVALNSIINGAYPSGFLNTIWTFIAVYGLIKGIKLFRK